MCIINEIIVTENNSNVFKKSFLGESTEFNIFECIQNIFESLFLKKVPKEEDYSTNIINEMKQFTHYNCGIQPRINISTYLERFHLAYGFSEETYVYAVICIDKLIQNTEINITRLNIHKYTY